MLDTQFVIKVAKWVIIVITISYAMMGVVYAGDNTVLLTDGGRYTVVEGDMVITQDTVCVIDASTHELVAVIEGSSMYIGTDGFEIISISSGLIRVTIRRED